MSSALSESDRRFIRDAAVFFENPGRTAKFVSRFGTQLAGAEKLLPESTRRVIREAAEKALYAAAKIAVSSLPRRKKSDAPADPSLPGTRRERFTHVGAASLIGAAGGFFGLAGLPLELTAVTITMLRGISEIAETLGFDPRDPEVQMHCLYVFSLGTPSDADDHLSSAYYSSRLAFTEVMREAAKVAVGLGGREILRAIESRTAPAVASLVVGIADQFQLRVARKVVAQSVPIAGALGGAAINAWFTDLFCECATFHFGLLRLEKEFGAEFVQRTFQTERAAILDKKSASTDR